MTIDGLYTVPHTDAAQRYFATVGVEVRVVCGSSETGFDFGVNGTTAAQRGRQRRAYRALSQHLGCLHAMGGTPRVVAPLPVEDPDQLPDDQLVQRAVGLGYLAGENNNPACMGLTMFGTEVASVVTSNRFVDSPSTWWAYIVTRGGVPFVITGVLACDWRMAHRNLVQRQIDLISQQVNGAGFRFSFEHLYVWISPGGRNRGIRADGSKSGLSISTAEAEQLFRANPQYEPFILPNAGVSAELPHGLDAIDLTRHQLFLAGVPDDNVSGLYEDTITTPSSTGTGYRWASEQRDADNHRVVNVLAGAVHNK